MDSVTQAVLGAAVYGAGMGRFQQRKALLIGAVLGTLPDLDVLIRYDDPISAMTFHRGWTHSIFLLTALAWLISWRVFKQNPQRSYSFARLFISIALALVTHPIIDAMTIYGTQLFYPLPLAPVSWATVFVIDPIYTLPLLISCIWALSKGLSHRTIKALRYSVIFGFVYFAVGFIGKSYHEQLFAIQLQSQGVQITRLASNPTPFNTLLWRVFAQDAQGNLYEGYSGYFDKQPPEWVKIPLNIELKSRVWAQSPLLQRLDWFTQSWLHYEQHGNQLVVSDMRMGYAGNMGGFRFVVGRLQNGKWQAIRPEHFVQDSLPLNVETAYQLWQRILGKGSLLAR